MRPSIFKYIILGFTSLILFSCSGSRSLTDNNFYPSEADAPGILSQIPDYRDYLHTIKGKARAIVSEPGNTERVTVLFSSNRQKSLITIRNNLGIEGGQLLTDSDTLLIYNKVDKYARKIPVRGANLNRINRLASLNILRMINYSVSEKNVDKLLENESLYQIQLSNGTKIFVDKNSSNIRQIIQPKTSKLPYSKIEYDSYTSTEGFTLPRRISIFGSEEKSKIALQITALELNPQLDSLSINIPDDIRIYYE